MIFIGHVPLVLKAGSWVTHQTGEMESLGSRKKAAPGMHAEGCRRTRSVCFNRSTYGQATDKLCVSPLGSTQSGAFPRTFEFNMAHSV